MYRKTDNKLLWLVFNAEELIAVTALTLMLVICSWNVVARYCLKNALSWADEICVLMLAWTTFVGSAAAYKRNLHFGMEFVLDRLSDRGKRLMRIGMTVLLAAVCAYLTYLSARFTMSAVKVMPFSRLSYKWIDASAVVGFGSMTIYSVIYTVQAFRAPEKFDARYQGDAFEEGESV